MTLVQAPALPVGLNQAEVAARVADGRVNVAPSPPGRTVAQIVRANVFTTFNALLGSLFVVALVVAPVQDSLFGLMVLWNTSIGTFQELRAKRTLDRLTVLSTPSARVRRAGAEVEVAPDEVVVDDIVVVGPGDQLVVDAEVVVADHLELDESLLTGEAEPQRRDAGDLLHSGSFVTAGAGWCRATAVGADAYAVRLADRARRPTTTHSELRAGIDRILRGIAVVLAPAAALLVWGQVRAGLGWREAAQRSVAGVVTMVPEGLVLLTSIAFAVGIVRLGRRRCLVKELAAVEGLARVSVVCLDKTGTLTAGSLRLAAVDVVEGTSPDLARRALVALVRADPAPNSTMQAIGAALAVEGGEWACTERVPFDSARKWSAARFDVGGDGDGGGAWVLGAPDVLLAPGDPLLDAVSARAEAGQRVLLVARAEKIAAAEGSSGGPPPLPVGLAPAALVGLEEELRPEVVETVGYFVRQGVELKVISGDNPRTVAAVARRAGIPGADRSLDARDLPEAPDELGRALEDHGVFGRVRPEQKRAMVAALQARGHTVAMTGDGVNDVLALKDADLGIAMGSGSGATRAVAQVVLLDGSFAALPHVVAEGRRVLANIEQVATLFLTKTVYAVLLAVAVGLAGEPYPFLPRHLTVVSTLSIGVPGFFLALAAGGGRARPGFVGRVLRYVAFTGPMSALAVLVVAAAVGPEPDRAEEVHGAALAVLLGVSLLVVAHVARPLSRSRLVLVAVLVALSAACLSVPVGQDVLALAWPGWRVAAVALAVVVAFGAVLEALHRTRLLVTPVSARPPG